MHIGFDVGRFAESVGVAWMLIGAIKLAQYRWRRQALPDDDAEALRRRRRDVRVCVTALGVGAAMFCASFVIPH